MQAGQRALTAAPVRVNPDLPTVLYLPRTHSGAEVFIDLYAQNPTGTRADADFIGEGVAAIGLRVQPADGAAAPRYGDVLHDGDGDVAVVLRVAWANDAETPADEASLVFGDVVRAVAADGTSTRTVVTTSAGTTETPLPPAPTALLRMARDCGPAYRRGLGEASVDGVKMCTSRPHELAQGDAVVLEVGGQPAMRSVAAVHDPCVVELDAPASTRGGVAWWRVLDARCAEVVAVPLRHGNAGATLHVAARDFFGDVSWARAYGELLADTGAPGAEHGAKLRLSVRPQAPRARLLPGLPVGTVVCAQGAEILCSGVVTSSPPPPPLLERW